ncbi:hypothetical protein ACQEV9_05280 [Streptomyces chartreusis]|uniref:hypothetical protein n=1 Tax=Streptomyces chartreusis TaxID=1969 RepID=UPI003D94B0B8
MSKIVWVKHRLMQLSFISFGAGVAFPSSPNLPAGPRESSGQLTPATPELPQG